MIPVKLFYNVYKETNMHRNKLILLSSRPTNPSFDEGGETTFTQADLDAAVAKSREGLFTAEQVGEKDKAHKASQQKVVDELKALQAKSTLTGEERVELENRITQLSDDLLTKEELAVETALRAKTKHGEEMKVVTDERDKWKRDYTESTIVRSITDAAVASEAFNPSQVVAILRDKASLTEVLDGEGRPTGGLITKIKFQGEKDGQPIELDLSAADAVKRMTEDDSFLNLFKGKGTGGTGGSGGSGGTKIDPRNMTPEQYKVYRKETLKL